MVHSKLGRRVDATVTAAMWTSSEGIVEIYRDWRRGVEASRAGCLLSLSIDNGVDSWIAGVVASKSGARERGLSPVVRVHWSTSCL